MTTTFDSRPSEYLCVPLLAPVQAQICDYHFFTLVLMKISFEPQPSEHLCLPILTPVLSEFIFINPRPTENPQPSKNLCLPPLTRVIANICVYHF